MKKWTLTLTHKDFNVKSISNIVIEQIYEKDIPIEFTDVLASIPIFENNDNQKLLKTIVYFKSASMLFKMMDDILYEMNNMNDSNEPINFFNIQDSFKSKRLFLRNKYPEYLI